jgi:hypothetical protein
MELVTLKSLNFNSYDNQAQLVVEVKRMTLYYSITYLIDVIDINRILNSLQKSNAGKDINACLSSVDYSDFTEYSLQVEQIENLNLIKDELEFIILNKHRKQIRA